MDGFHSGWFFENWDGLTVAIEVEELLCEEKTKYQNIVLFKSTHFGNVLVLDGVIQCTERDEFPYHEMMTHLPLFSHPNPRKVLIIGGGDGGVIREASKLSAVEEIHICVDDQRVIDLSKQYLPTLSIGFSSPKVTVHIEDSVVTFLERNIESYDVIIVDSSGGPDKELSKKSFYFKVDNALKQDGIVCSIADCVWTDMDIIKNLMDTFRCVFPVVRYAFGQVVPVFVGGQIGFVLGSKNKDTVFEDPIQQIKDEDVMEMKLRYYNREMHKACFVLPQFIKDTLEN